MRYSFPNRTLCEVLEEMRNCYKTRNFAYLLGLIEELQSLGNKMEAAIGDKRDMLHYREERSKLKKEIRELEKKRKKLGGKKKDDEE